ncbi:MAG TPA: hypothetical protein VMK53_05680 [Gemmatimonadales bacterium]|nr:hypothetical protein [Gemmatimonadales bacterium]
MFRTGGYRTLISALALVGVAGCGATDSVSSRDPLLVEAGFLTDAASYVQAVGVSPVASIRVLFENRFGRTLIPVPCTADAPEWALERLSGERWTAAATSACKLVSWVPSPIQPGEEYRATVHLEQRVQPGTYRLVFGLLEETGDATVPVVDGRALSNPFMLAN